MSFNNKHLKEWTTQDFMSFIRSLGIPRKSYKRIQTAMDENGLLPYHFMRATPRDIKEMLRVNLIVARRISLALRDHMAAALEAQVARPPSHHRILDSKEEKKADIEDEITEAIQQIKLNPQSSRENIFRLAKQSYKQQQSPVIVDRANALSDIKKNAAHFKNVALPLTVAIDQDFNTWNEQQFKRNFSAKLNIPMECIHILSVRAGSVIADVRLETHSTGNKLLIPIETLADNITSEKARKALVEFGIFAMEFSEPTAGFNCLKQRVILNPQWNREYGQGYTTWSGALNDGKTRGNEPYFCPSGWKRFAIQFSETAYDFAGMYDKWPIAYHGTKFDFSMMITLSGLRTTGGDHGVGVYMSPSIKYVSHPRYCKPHKLDLSKATQKEWSADQLKEFRKYDGKWIQCAFACRVKPGSFKKANETMAYWTDFPSKNGKFDNIDINTIEWLVGGKSREIIGCDKILIYGIMIRASDVCQKGYE